MSGSKDNDFNELKETFKGLAREVKKVFRGAPEIKTKKPKKNMKLGPSKAISIGGQQAAVIKFNNARGLYSMNPQGSQFVVERTEPVLSVVGSATLNNYGLQQVKVLPMGEGFRWLGNMANSFTSYEIQRMEFTYVPSVPTTAAGAISMSFQEDYKDNQPASIEDQLLSEQSLYAPVYGGTDGGRYLQRFGAPEGNVVSFTVPDHAFKSSTGSPMSFKIVKGDEFNALISSGGDAGFASSRLYSPGRVWVGTQGGAVVSQVFGQVFCRYRIKLFGAIAFGLQK